MLKLNTIELCVVGRIKKVITGTNKNEKFMNEKFINGLLQSLNLYIKEEISFSILETVFYDVFVEYEGRVEESTDNFFSDICEKMDYTSLGIITKVEKSFGWVTDIEFRIWLRKNLCFRANLSRESNIIK